MDERVSDGAHIGVDAVDSEFAEWLASRGGERRAAAGVGGPDVGRRRRRCNPGCWRRRSVPPTNSAPGNWANCVRAAAVLYESLATFCWAVRRWLGTPKGLRFDFGLTFKGSDVGWGFRLSLGARFAALVLVLPLYFIDEDLVAPEPDRLRGMDADVGALFVFTIVALESPRCWRSSFSAACCSVRSRASCRPPWP